MRKLVSIQEIIGFEPIPDADRIELAKVMGWSAVVKKGELLISGVLNSQSHGVRYVNADGSVLAYVNKTISVKIPLKSQEKYYHNNTIKDTEYIFFSNTIKLFKNNNKNDKLCDIIEKTEFVYLFGQIKLPIQRITKQYLPYEIINVEYSIERASQIAIKELNSQIKAISLNSEIISKNINTSYSNDEVLIQCNLYCVEDIAKSVEFYVQIKE